MKELCMISQPMNGLSDEEILNTRSRAISAIRGMGYELENTYFGNLFIPDGADIPVYYLAKAIEKMANCKAVYFTKGWAQHRGCRIEHQIALEYGYKCIYE